MCRTCRSPTCRFWRIATVNACPLHASRAWTFTESTTRIARKASSVPRADVDVSVEGSFHRYSSASNSSRTRRA
ncbi:hypothetical protein BDV98DRAFT_571990 [Pterulicium gracile]|uniref:Uncharacterized protein n=1 Tax=Pterulicium gracile TaxID=1884261 RepID=A0A5C3QCZ1_9AGAR|nr:hypothetical protein BDV98DRAFT_571990 [Pterula gracilis]